MKTLACLINCRLEIYTVHFDVDAAFLYLIRNGVVSHLILKLGLLGREIMSQAQSQI